MRVVTLPMYGSATRLNKHVYKISEALKNTRKVPVIWTGF